MDLSIYKCYETILKGGKMFTGMVEGYYGKPFSSLQRDILMRNLSHLDEPVYLYAPKNDPYHRIRWREKYSGSAWKDIEHAIESAAENGVRFFFGISPFGFRDDEYGLLESKIKKAVDAGAAGIAILYDDIPENADAGLARKQIEFTRKGLSDAEIPVMVCPSIYCGEFIERLNGSEYLEVLGEELPSEWDVLWTGSTVISKSLSNSDILRAKNLLGRAPVIWDNLHANDYCMRRVFFGKLDGRLSSSKGYLLNPSECFPAALHSVFRLAAAAGAGEKWPVELGPRLPGWETLSGFHDSPWTVGTEVEILLAELRDALQSGGSDKLVARLGNEIEKLNELIGAVQCIEGGFDLLPHIIDVRKILVWWLNALEKEPVGMCGRELKRQVERILPEHPFARMTFNLTDRIE